MSARCQKCHSRLARGQRLELLLKGRTNPINCTSCGEPLVLKFSYQFFVILALAIGGGSLASASTDWRAMALAGFVSLTLVFVILCFAPVESVSNQEQAIKEELGLNSIKVYRIILVVTAAIYSFVVLVFDSNILSAIAMLYAAIYVTKTNAKPIVSLIAALLSLLLLYLI